MKKAVLILVAVAILGTLAAVVDKKIASNPNSGASNSSSQNLSSRSGTFEGSAADTPYGIVQIRIVVLTGKITDVNFLKMPNADDRSRQITALAEPRLKANTIKAQSAHIEFVSGATSTSFGYQESLQAALDKAAGSSFVLTPKARS